MKAFGFVGLFMVLVAASSPAWAQDDEIIVTASRYVQRNERVQLPAVTITRRADFAVATMAVESDTRELGQRRAELMQTLNELQTRARANGPVSVALIEEAEESDGETRVKPYTAALAQAQITSGSRPDTSVVRVLLRTAVQPNDTLESVEGRLDAFVRSLPKPGRVTLGVRKPELTLIDPSQYRSPVIAAIATDAKKVTDALGAGYGVRISGLQSRLAWRRTGDLALTIYIPHTIEIEPVGVR